MKLYIILASKGLFSNAKYTKYCQHQHPQTDKDPAFEGWITLITLGGGVIKQRHEKECIAEKGKGPIALNPGKINQFLPDFEETGRLDAKEPASIVEPKPNRCFHCGVLNRFLIQN